MQSEQQQRIMEYFIEEAKDHLNTIEQGLLSLQSTIEDREMLNELFRAAHSVKGGAAMLGLHSIQHTSHRLEDCFKVLQELPVKADSQLESFFLRVFDTLQALVEQLQSPFGLTDEAASEIMSEAEPVFEELNTHLENLVQQAERASVATVEAPKVALANSQMTTRNTKTLPATFKRDVLVELREMLQLFKQQDLPEHREALQENCRHLVRLGEQLDLPGWSELLETSRAAIACPSNSYRLLANLVIKEIKQAQELVVTGRSVEISPSEQLQALVPDYSASVVAEGRNIQEPEISPFINHELELDARQSEFVSTNRNRLPDELESSQTHLFDNSDTDSLTTDSATFSEQLNESDFELDTLADFSDAQTPSQPEPEKTRTAFRFAAPSEPEVGMAELNTLADIFEGQMPDLDQTWQEEEIISLDDRQLTSDPKNLFSLDDSSDFSDLVGDLDSLDSTDRANASTGDDLMDLFGDETADRDAIATSSASEPSVHTRTPSDSPLSSFDLETSLDTTDEFSDLLFEEETSEPLLSASSDSDDLSSLFGDSFFEENSPFAENQDAFELEAQATPHLTEEDDLFAMPEADIFDEAPVPFSTPTDDVHEIEDAFSESFTASEHDFLAFADSSQARDDTDSDEMQWEAAPLTESDMDFGDLLDISEPPVGASLEEQDLSEALALDDTVPEFSFDEFVLNESAADLDFDGSGDLTVSEWELDSTADSPSETTHAQTPSIEPSLEDSFFDISTPDLSDPNIFSDFGLEDVASAHEFSASERDGVESLATSDWNWDEEQEIALDDLSSNIGGDFTDTAAVQMPEVAQEEPLLGLEEPELVFDDFDLAGIDTTSEDSELDFDLGSTSTSLSNDDFDLAGIDTTSEDSELDFDLGSTSTSLSNDDFDLAGIDTTSEDSKLDFDLGSTSTSLFDVEVEGSGDSDRWLEDEALSLGEISASAAVDDLETDNWLEASTAETTDLDSEALDLSSFDESETHPDFDHLDSFFGAETPAETENVDVTPATGAVAENSLDWEDFSIVDTPSATDQASVSSLQTADLGSEDSEEETVPGLAVPEEAFEELDFDLSTIEGMAELADVLFDNDEESFFDWEGAESTPAIHENTATEQTSASDLEALFGDEAPEETESFDSSSALSDDLNWDANWLTGESLSPELELEAEPEATAEAQAPMFEWEDVAQTATPDTTLESPPSSDWERLSGDELFGNTEAFEVEQELLLQGIAADGEQHSAPAAADDFFNWEDGDAAEVDSLENFLEAETAEVTDAHDWDALLDAAQDTGTPDADIAALSDALDLEATDEEELPALNLDWESSTEEHHFAEAPQELAMTSSLASEFDDLEAMLNLETSTHTPSAAASLDEFADLEAMLVENVGTPSALEATDLDVFHDLDALLEEQTAVAQPADKPSKRAASAVGNLEDEFGELESLLEEANKTMGGPPAVMPEQGRTRPLMRARPTRVFEHTMRVPVKHLDSLSNLVGELVVNRNTLEQDQERLRQFLDNLSHQVLALSDVGSRMQDLYERSLLESSLLAGRQSYRPVLHSDGGSGGTHGSGVEYDPLEMDRFTGFHLLSQEMIELIVRVRESASDIEFLVDETDQVARMLRQITTQLQEGLTRARMVPFAQNADRLLRAVHEISRKLGKEAQLHVEGRETLIDKMILEHLYDPMTHLVNNALTHGIESPEVRKAAGKPRVGRITLRAFHQGNQTVIAISDDGAGIDAERVRCKAVEQKLLTPDDAKTMTHVELYDCLFHPGFSTKDKADDFSGRGVGMDVVRTSLSEIRGTIHIDSAVGKGTTFTIRLPLTLSICKALCCLSDRARIAFPMDGVEDMMDVSSDRIQTNAEGHPCIQWRDTLLPFHPLAELLTYKRQLSRNTVYGGKREDDMISIVVLRSAGNFLAIQVDQVLGEQEIVIKQLEGPPPKPVGIAGATVLGDGRIMAIADVLELIDLAMGRIRKDGAVAIWAKEEPQVEVPAEVPEAKHEPMVLIVDDSITVRELLSMTFNKAGYRVEQARDGQEAWEKLRSGLPCDIVFCDIEMPRMDGLELLSRLQKDENLCDLPIAMLTSRGADRHRQMASQLGASGYFTKPYLEEVLLDAAQRMIKGEVLFSSSSNA